ncbi:hypothetical protein DMH01_07380 [Amycolatopsis sp. WAC 04182]|nr:hypothetical protein DMH01_07380 [Amycolatopsis sp. WAC 04182]
MLRPLSLRWAARVSGRHRGCESHFRNVEGCESGFRNVRRQRARLHPGRPAREGPLPSAEPREGGLHAQSNLRARQEHPAPRIRAVPP